MFYLFFQALNKFQTTTKLTTISGIEQEESLLNESAARETSLQTQIIDLENETKQVKNQTNLHFINRLRSSKLFYFF